MSALSSTTPGDPSRTPIWRRAGAVLFWTGIFALAHTQAPLYFSNQNQYYLHGAAQGGLGFLNEDWLANTVDPTPVFTAIIAFTQRYLHLGLVYLYYALFLGVYFHALLAIYDHITEGKSPGLARLVYITALVVIHAGILRLASVHLVGKDYPWYLQAGVAGQYILGPVFQPSVGGVLLLAAIALFLRGYIWFALASAVGGAVLHATYVLGAGFLILAFLIVLYRERRKREALLLGVAAGVLLAPWIIYNVVTFAPTLAAAFTAQDILVHTRIPHHAVVARWCDWIAMVQIAWMTLAAMLTFRSRLYPLFLDPLLAATALTVLQVVTNSDALALLFPWRISAVLMPLATAVILALLMKRLQGRLEGLSRGKRQTMSLACGVILMAAVLGGVAINTFGLGYHMSEEELPLLEYVRTHKQRGDVYLLPVELPKVGSGPRGVVSTSFTPPPKRGKTPNLIAVDLQRFRLHTGAPIFVDFKSIPYKDVDVLEWWERMNTTQRWYARNDWSSEELHRELVECGITHVVITADRELAGDWLDRVYEDAYYRLYRLRPALAPNRQNDRETRPPPDYGNPPS